MTKVMLVLSLMVAVWSITPLVNSNGYTTVSKYTTIQVKAGDSVWSIATKYVTDRDDIRELTQAMQQVNGLQHNGQIFPGQVLKVPLRE